MKNGHSRILTVALAAVSAILLYDVPARAADPDFEGKTIRFMVGFGVGGGYDTYSRILAPYYERELGAKVIVENLPGAGGMKVLNRFAVAPPEALMINMVNGTGAVLQQLVGLKGMRFDLTKFGYLGVIDSPRWVWLVSPNSDVKTPLDAIKRTKKLSWGGSGQISGTSDGAAFTCHILKLKCNIVTGYKGSRAAALAVAQGEMDALYVSETSAINYVQSKNAKAVATMSRKRSHYFPDLPAITELVTLDKEQQWWLDYRSTLEDMGRILVVPPSTPKPILAKLQAATARIVTSKKFLDEAKKLKRDVNFIAADKSKEAVVSLLESVTPQQKAAIRKVVIGK